MANAYDNSFLFFLFFEGQKTEIGVDKPAAPCYNNSALGRLAQLVEHALDVRRVSGSSPLSSTKRKSHPNRDGFFLLLRY